MQNYKAFDKIRDEFARGEHFQSAEKENAQYVNSLDGKLNKLKETWTDTFTTLVNSNLAYGALDGLIGISEAINKIVNALTKMNGGLTGGLFATISMLKNIPKAFNIEDKDPRNTKGIISNLENLDSVMSNKADSIEANSERIEKSTDKISNIDVDDNNKNVETSIETSLEKSKDTAKKQGVEIGSKASEGINEGLEKGSKNTQSIGRNMGISLSEGIDNGVEKAKTSFKNFGDSVKNIGSSILNIGKSALLSFGVGMALEVGLKAVYSLYDSIAHKYENQKRAIQERTEAIKQESNTHKENLRWLEQNRDRYDELIKKEKEYSNIDRDSWTDTQKSEMQELLGMKEELAEMFPELVAGYDEMGNPIIAMTDSMQGLIDKTKEQIKLLQTEMVQQKIDAGDNAREEINSRKLKYGGQKLTDKLNDEFKSFASNADFYTDKVSTASTSWKNFAQNRKDYTKKMIQDQKELNKTLSEYNKLENEIQAGQLAKFQNQSNYEGLNNDAKGKINTLISSLDWGNLNDEQFSNWQSGIDQIINNFPEIGNKVSDIITKVNEVNSAFSMSKISPEEYSKSIDSLARELADLTGMDFNSIKEGFDQMFAFDPKIQDKTEMLKAFGKELKDVQTDAIANSLSNQYDSADKMQTKLIEIETQAEAKVFLKDIKSDKNISQEIKDYVQNAVNDGEYTDVEKQITFTLTEIVKHGGTASKGDEQRLQKLLNGDKLTEKEIQLGIKFKDGEKLNEKQFELLKGINDKLPKDAQINASDLINTDGLIEKISIIESAFKKIDFGDTQKEAFEGIKNSSLSTKEEIGSLAQAVEKIPKEKRTDFVSNYADSFKGVKNMKEGIENLPDEVKLVYEIGIENDDRLKGLKETLDKMPKSVQTDFKMGKIDTSFLDKWNSIKSEKKSLFLEYAQEGTINKDLFYDIVNNYPEHIDKIVSLIQEGEIDENTLANLKKLSDLDPEIQKKIKILVDDSETKKIEKEPITNATAEVTKHIDKKGNSKVNFDTTDASKAIDNLNSKIQKLKSKKITITVATQTARKNISGLITRINQVNTALNSIKGKTITVNTAQARQNISGLIRKVEKFNSKVGNKTVTFSSNTAQASKNITGLIKNAERYKGKTYHASFIAHTAQAYQKITALISKCKAYGGKTYHASFIAHTAHAYSKISALVSKAQSYGGRTFHASMTVTKNIVTNTKPSGKPQKSIDNITRTVTTTYADDGIMPIDESVTDNSVTRRGFLGRARESLSSKRESIKFNEYSSYLDKMTGGAKAIKEAFMLMHEMVDKAIKDTVGKTTKLADIVKQGTTVVLTSITNSVKDILDALKFDINRLQELDNTIARISHSIDMLDKKLDNSVGSQRIAFLQRQNLELKKRIKLNEELLKQKKREKDIYKQELKKKGIKFTKDDNISNYEETMLKLKREMEKLDQTSEKASEKETKRNEKRKKEIEELIKLMEAFNKLVYGDIFDIESSIIEDSNQIEDNELEIKQIEYEKWVVNLESAFKNINKELQKLTNQLDMLDVKMEHAWGKEKLDLMQKQIDLIKKSQSALKDNLTVMESAKNSAKNKLIEYGFKFNQNGDIENFVETMNHLKDTSKEFDTIQGLVDGYFDLYLEQIPEAERELAEFTNQIKDIYKEQLNATKELEDKIIDMYKKQLEERKKLIDEELNKRLDALKKEQDAYKRAREEQNYKDDFNEQADKVKEIQKQIDLARKDTSLTGQKKLKDLLKQLEEEKKKLDEITQDRIDQQVDNAFKDEEDRLQQGAEDEKDRLDEMFSDEELLKKAQEAIKNGLFIGIDGEVKNLQSALLEYIDKWEEGLSATGAIIKSEWITNLEIANNLIKDYVGVLDSIGVGSLNTNDIYNKIPNIKLDSESKGNNAKSINYNQPLVVVQGNVNDNNINQIEKTIKEAIDRNNREILRKI
ncbi:hypothetical protein [Fusobacterium sp.]|uniref:hypothetical protein n=1 Tax=Fusobacterium sp. TaxID=68766 RepID=UPI002630619F|nr:hypothetical protein [Fusobacterium sp.]